MKKLVVIGTLLGVLALSVGMWAKTTAAAAAGEEKGEVVELTGILVKVSAVGTTTTGWELHFPNPVNIDGKSLSAVELDGDPHKFQKLENLRIGVKGIVLHPSADRTVIKVQKLKENA
ncbi:MAG TPA: hypothetical protein VMH31_12560 [Methylomirabilota bacterium]|nr:hypothetical protein [Methylomirabilota bacterium]HUI50473.1 hypothetical protein [Terriglobales bacterium]